MRFRSGIIALILLLSGVASAADIVIVKSSDAEPYAQAEEPLRSQFAAHQHKVRTVVLADVNSKGIASLGTPGAVLAVGTPAATWLHGNLPPATPLVYCMVANPAGMGLAEGRASYGVTTDIPYSVQFQVIAEALPNARTVGTLYRSDNPESRRQLKALESALPAGWRIESVAVNDNPSVAAAIDALVRKRIDLVWTGPDSAVYDSAAVRSLLLAALRNQVPVWGFSPAFVRAGAMLGVGVDPRAQGAQAAEVALRILENPAARIEKAIAPSTYQLAVNPVVAEQLGIQVPERLIRRAQFVFRGDK
jgi:putative tryptophan/tyrosine transport system substrate-binding protein